jgi:hypothetical protein
MRELSNQVAGDGSSELPTVLASQLLRVFEELIGGDIRMGVEVVFPFGKRRRDIVSQFQF